MRSIGSEERSGEPPCRGLILRETCARAHRARRASRSASSARLEVAWGGRVADVGGVKARALIARLLIDRGLVVSVDRLVDSLWGDHDGDGAEIALRSTISRVRKRLRQTRACRRISS